jgi:hypothetical protein
MNGMRGVCAGLLVLAGVTGAMAVETDFVLNVLPAAVVVDLDSNGFTASDPNVETVEASTVYMMPNLSAGIGFQFSDFYVDVTGGGGILLTDAFRSFMLQGVVAAYWEASRSFEIGPHIGITYFPNPEWLEPTDVEFEDSWGWIAGLGLSMGDKITYLVSIDLMGTTFDAESGPGVKADDELELMALAFQFGVRGLF